MNMLMYPDMEWDIQKVSGKEMGNPSALLAKLDRALQMGPGKLPAVEDAKWKNIIATEEAPKPKPAVEAKKPQLAGRTSAAPSPLVKPARPERTGTKRRYNDSSYEGYEGYDDAAAESTGGEEERWGGGAKKKRRKVISTPASVPASILALLLTDFAGVQPSRQSARG